MSLPAGDTAGVILAGGRSKRMDGAIKGLLLLHGQPLLRHVIDRVAPQVGELMLSVQRPSQAMEIFSLPQVADPAPDGGPLAGLFAAMKRMRAASAWLTVVPCDAPFLPADLSSRLLAHALETDRPGAAVRYGGQLQPTFSIWHRELLSRLETAVLEEGRAGLRRFCGLAGLAELDWPEEDPSPFFNINDRGTLNEAARLLASSEGAEATCEP